MKIIDLKNKISRWHVELFLLGILLVPILLFVTWLQSYPSALSDIEFIKKTLIGICAGVISTAIWVLGSSMIIINILRDILISLKSSDDLNETHIKKDTKE